MPRLKPTAERLLDAALAVFDRRGMDGFTVHAVVAHAKISLGSLYHHFGSFDGLAAALYARCMATLLSELADRVEASSSARAGIVTFVRAYLEFTRREAKTARFIHASSYATFLPLHAETIARAKEPGLGRLLAWLRPHVAAGHLVDLPSPLVEMLLVGPVAEVSRRWLAGAPEVDLALASALLPARVWRSVRGPRRQT